MFRLLAFAFILLFSFSGRLGYAVEITPINDRFSLGKDVQFLRDDSRQLTLDGAQKAETWQQSSQAIPNFGFTNAIYWFRVDLNTRELSSAYFLEVDYALLDEVEAFVFLEGRQVNHWLVGNAVPTANRPIKHRTPLFPLKFENNKHYSLYLRVRASSSMQVPITLWEERAFWQEEQFALAFHAAYFGIVIVMCLYNVFLYFSLREKNYLLYVMVIFNVALFLAQVQGYNYQYLWPDSTDWNNRSLGVAISISNAFFLLLCTEFLNLKQHFPRLFKLHDTFTKLNFLSFFAALIFDPSIVVPLATLNVALNAVLQVVFSFLLWGRDRSARLFFVAWYALIAGTEMMALDKLGLIDRTFLSDNLLQIGAILEAFLLSLALAERIRILEKDKMNTLQALTHATEEAFAHEQREQRAVAESRSKSEFLAKMSHEIRTPMNGILGMSELLGKRLVDPTDKQYNEIIYSSGKSLLNLINDILDLSKIEAGKMELEVASFDLRKLLEQTGMLFAANQADVSLRFNVAEDVPVWLKGDSHRLRQILVNLISNAFKFTEKGEITVQVALEQGSGQLIRFEVSDTGIGISVDAQKKLFKAFEQADSSTTRRYGGTGLGLTICRQLTELMGGSIGLSSELGRGSTFWFTAQLPAGEPVLENNSVTSKEELSSMQQSLSVLVADDNQVNRMVINGMLAKLGHKTVLKENGLHALTAFNDAVTKGNERPFDCILMDCEMPEMDGFEATLAIRNLESSQQLARVPIIALTAHALQENLERCLAAGMDKVLTKPIDLKTLEAAMQNVALQQRTGVTQASCNVGDSQGNMARRSG